MVSGEDLERAREEWKSEGIDGAKGVSEFDVTEADAAYVDAGRIDGGDAGLGASERRMEEGRTGVRNGSAGLEIWFLRKVNGAEDVTVSFIFGFSTRSSSKRKRKSRPYSWRSCGDEVRWAVDRILLTTRTFLLWEYTILIASSTVSGSTSEP